MIFAVIWFFVFWLSALNDSTFKDSALNDSTFRDSTFRDSSLNVCTTYTRTWSRWLPLSLTVGVYFWLRIFPEIRRKNCKSFNSWVRDLCRTDIKKNWKIGLIVMHVPLTVTAIIIYNNLLYKNCRYWISFDL